MPVFIALVRPVDSRGDGQAADRATSSGSVEGRIPGGAHLYRERQRRRRAGSLEAEARTALEAELKAYAGKPVGAIVRTAAEMSEVLANNPFPDRCANQTVAIFLDAPPAADALSRVTGQTTRRFGRAPVRYIRYPDGIGRSKLRIPAAQWNRAAIEHRR